MSWVLLFLLPAVVFAMFAALSPPVGPPPRWRVRLGRLVAAATRPARTAASRRRKPAPIDPFN